MAVTSTAVPSGSIATTFGNKFQYVDLREGLAGLPQKIAIFATYDPLKTSVVPDKPVQVFTGGEAGEKFGFGSPAHLAARQTLKFSRVVPVFIFPIEEAAGAVAAEGNILVVGTSTSSGTISIYIGGQEINVTVSSATTPANIATAIVAAVAAKATDLPVTAVVNGVTPEQVDFTSRYKGAIANDITIAINLEQNEQDVSPVGVSFTITDMASGAGTPEVTDALNEFGDNWYTWVVNAFGTNTDVMDEFDEYNELNGWDPLKNTFFRAIYGSADDYSTITAITDARKLDRTNGVICSSGAYSLPLELAAAAVGSMADRNQDTPAQPYTGLTLDGLLPGADSEQWDHTVADSAEKLGSSWTLVRDGKITIKEMIMHYHKTGEEPPAFRYAVDIAKLAEWAYNARLIFEGENWEGKILVDDSDVVQNPEARKPRDAVAEIYALADAAAIQAAIITRPDFTKANTVASIDIANPNRINIRTILVLSGATRIVSLTTSFGFNFGSLAA